MCVHVCVCSVLIGVSIYLLKGTFQVHSAKLHEEQMRIWIP